MVRSWFFGGIERDEAEQLLMDSAKKRGTFLSIGLQLNVLQECSLFDAIWEGL